MALVLCAVGLAWPWPRMLARVTSLRRAPRAALVLWQAGAVGAVLAALFAAPGGVIAVVETTDPGVRQWPLLLAGVVTGVVAARLLFSGDRVGRRLRTARKNHRELVDLLAPADAADLGEIAHANMRVLEHPTPTAYCVPGLDRRVVITRGTLDSLTGDELAAVLLHERAHLRARHDLVLEFFTVMHEAVPRFVRSPEALHSVTLLIEVLADRAAVRGAGVLATARAIVAMAGGGRPDGSLGMAGQASSSVSDSRLRIDLLDGGRVLGLPNAVASALMYAVATVVVATPVVLLTFLLAGTGWFDA